MASVHDVAAFIVGHLGTVGAMKLQKLVYYAQAWSLVWDRQVLFSEQIEAWDQGPVVRALWERCARTPVVDRVVGDPSRLSAVQRATTLATLAFYGDRSGTWLNELMHREAPWVEARGKGGAASPVISRVAIRAFFAKYPTPFRAIPESVARGLYLVMSLPPSVAHDAIHRKPMKVNGLEEWLETGHGDPWKTTA